MCYSCVRTVYCQKGQSPQKTLYRHCTSRLYACFSRTHKVRGGCCGEENHVTQSHFAGETGRSYIEHAIHILIYLNIAVEQAWPGKVSTVLDLFFCFIWVLTWVLGLAGGWPLNTRDLGDC